MATDIGEKTYLSHTSQELDDGLDAIPFKALQADLAAEVTAREKTDAALQVQIDSGAKNLVNATSGSGTRFVNIPVVLQPGTYHILFSDITSTDTDATKCQCAAFDSGNADVSNYLQLGRGSAIDGTLTVTATTAYIRLYASNSYGNSAGDTVDFTDCMICTEADWNISQKYVPYCPTMAELYQMILDLGGGTRSMNAATTEEQEEQR